MSVPAAGAPARAVARVGLAAAAAQGIGLAVAPVASRLYGDEAFGAFGLWFGLANILVPFVLLGLPDAMVAATDDADADALLGDTLRLMLWGAPLAVVLTGLLRAVPSSGYGTLTDWAVLLMWPEVAAVALIMALQAWTIRRLRFGALAVSHVVQASTRAALQIGAGNVVRTAAGLSIAEIGSRWLTALGLLAGAWHDVRRAWRVPTERRRRTRYAYRRFAWSRTSSVVLNNLGTALPQTLVTALYGLGEGGQYALLATALAVPAALVQKSIGDVFLGSYAVARREAPASAHALLRTTATQLALLSVIPAVTLVVAGPWLFAFVFGAGWTEAGRLAQWMAPSLAADLAIGPLGGVVNVVGRPERKLWFDGCRLGGIAGAYAVAHGLSLPPVHAVALQSAATCVAYAAYGWAIFRASRES